MPSHKHSKSTKNTDIIQDTKPTAQNNAIIKPLLALPSARDLPEVKQAVNKIKNIDKLWIKYTTALNAYPLIRSEFLAHPANYTHLILCPDDLVVEPEKLQYLIDDYTKALTTEEERNNTILTGFCNVDSKSNNDKANICTDPVLVNRHGRTYPWIKISHLRTLKHNIDISENPQPRDYLIPVGFAGFPLYMIPRSIVEQIPFRDDSDAEYKQTGVCQDVTHCHDSQEKGFKIYTDVRVDLQHLKYTKNSDIQLQLQRMRERKGYQNVNHPMINQQIQEAKEHGEIDYLFRPHIKYDYSDHSHILLIDIPEIK